jgi:hypothetical protein
MKKNKVGRPLQGRKEKVRILFSIDPDVAKLFQIMFKDENKSKMIENFMRAEIGKRGITE